MNANVGNNGWWGTVPRHKIAQDESQPGCMRGCMSEAKLNYWSYIGVDDLLGLGAPQTVFPDERVFIRFHQMAELCFALIIGELEQLLDARVDRLAVWKGKLARVVHYYQLLGHLTGTLRHCLDREQFLAFRKALSPASAFQSYQYRKIEFLSARVYDLIPQERRACFSPEDAPEALFEQVYWRKAVSADRSDKERAMLVDFEEKYLGELRELAVTASVRNVASQFASLPSAWRHDPELVNLLRHFDRLANAVWPGIHYALASKLLDGEESGSTGGTDWRRYLKRSKQQRVCFFPELATGADLQEFAEVTMDASGPLR